MVLVHCFNHRLELPLKDAFDKSLFGKIDTMLTKLYYSYQKSPKGYHELKELSEAYNKSQSHWKMEVTVGLTINAMSLMLENYGAYISHLESFSQKADKHWKELISLDMQKSGWKQNTS